MRPLSPSRPAAAGVGMARAAAGRVPQRTRRSPVPSSHPRQPAATIYPLRSRPTQNPRPPGYPSPLRRTRPPHMDPGYRAMTAAVHASKTAGLLLTSHRGRRLAAATSISAMTRSCLLPAGATTVRPSGATMHVAPIPTRPPAAPQTSAAITQQSFSTAHATRLAWVPPPNAQPSALEGRCSADTPAAARQQAPIAWPARQSWRRNRSRRRTDDHQPDTSADRSQQRTPARSGTVCDSLQEPAGPDNRRRAIHDTGRASLNKPDDHRDRRRTIAEHRQQR